MKPEQAPIEITKELHELNKKLDKIINILSVKNEPNVIHWDPNKITITPYNPANPYEITCATGNPEAHDYGVGYLGKGTGDAEQEQH